MLNRDSRRCFVTLGDPDRVNSPLQEALRLLEKRAGHDDDAGGAIANLVVLAPRKFYHELRDLVVHVHLLEDGGAVVGCKTKKELVQEMEHVLVAHARKFVELTDGDVAVGALEHLVHAFGTEGGTEDPRDGFAGGDVRFLSVQTSESALLLLFLQDYERPSELVESQRHFYRSISSSLLHRTNNRKEEMEEEERAKTLLSPNPNLLLCYFLPTFFLIFQLPNHNPIRTKAFDLDIFL